MKKIWELASYIKDLSFSQEKEWRIIIEPTTNNLHAVHYRESDSLLIPYFEMEPMEPECISKIVVGPCPHMDLSCNSVQRFVYATLGRQPNVEKSIIPYRNL